MACDLPSVARRVFPIRERQHACAKADLRRIARRSIEAPPLGTDDGAAIRYPVATRPRSEIYENC
jgi:hypothetical protein